MISPHSIDAPPAMAAAKGPAVALGAAVALRDLSLREYSTVSEQHACRALMREAAFAWRHALLPVQKK